MMIYAFLRRRLQVRLTNSQQELREFWSTWLAVMSHSFVIRQKSLDCLTPAASLWGIKWTFRTNGTCAENRLKNSPF